MHCFRKAASRLAGSEVQILSPPLHILQLLLYNHRMKNESLDSKTIDDIVKGLKKLEPGFLPFDIFVEICRLTVSATVEIVPFRKKGDRSSVEILLVKRKDDDPFWPGMYHIPGVVILATDKENSLKDAFDRILHGELGGVSTSSEPVYIKYLLRKGNRGTTLNLLHRVELTSDPKVGEWFDVNNLPKNLIPPEKDVIEVVTNHCA